MIEREVDLLLRRRAEGVRDAGHGPEDERNALNTGSGGAGTRGEASYGRQRDRGETIAAGG